MLGEDEDWEDDGHWDNEQEEMEVGSDSDEEDISDNDNERANQSNISSHPKHPLLCSETYKILKQYPVCHSCLTERNLTNLICPEGTNLHERRSGSGTGGNSYVVSR